MPTRTHLALLRGINVGGNKRVAMADLRSFVEHLGFQNPRTLLQSGNLVFESNGEHDDATLESYLEREAAKYLGLDTAFLVRSTAEWAEIIAHNPFQMEAAAAPSRLVVMFCRTPPAPEALQALRDAMVGNELIHTNGRQLYAFFPDGISRSPMSNVLMNAKFSKLATGRNWNTITKLGALAGA